MDNLTRDWPEDADGDVFRRMERAGFDFSQNWTVDYNVDFEVWPPPATALDWLEERYGELALYAPDDDMGGYVQFQVVGPVSYDGVTAVQRTVSAALGPHGGICESWGVLH